MSQGVGGHLDVIVRFSTATPDITLSIESPAKATGLALKQRIRNNVEGSVASSRLRLIHAGKVIHDTAPLTRSINIPAPPTRGEVDGKSAKAKGKQAAWDTALPAARIYVHCSVGDALTPSELVAEARAAYQAETALKDSSVRPPSSEQAEESAGPSTTREPSATTTTPASRGFDRLLSAGFTAPEVAALRAQFLAIQAHSHTPDDMPTGHELLALEERWLDSGTNASGAGGAEEGGGFGFEDTGGLEDMLYGNLIGFFWPVGAICWLIREEGVWSRRRQIAVLSGFLVNLTFGFLRIMN